MREAVVMVVSPCPGLALAPLRLNLKPLRLTSVSLTRGRLRRRY